MGRGAFSQMAVNSPKPDMMGDVEAVNEAASCVAERWFGDFEVCQCVCSTPVRERQRQFEGIVAAVVAVDSVPTTRPRGQKGRSRRSARCQTQCLECR